LDEEFEKYRFKILRSRLQEILLSLFTMSQTCDLGIWKWRSLHQCWWRSQTSGLWRRV